MRLCQLPQSDQEHGRSQQNRQIIKIRNYSMANETSEDNKYLCWKIYNHELWIIISLKQWICWFHLHADCYLNYEKSMVNVSYDTNFLAEWVNKWDVCLCLSTGHCIIFFNWSKFNLQSLKLCQFKELIIVNC